MNNQEINLYWHNYKFFPYEKKFAVREVTSLLEPKYVEEFSDRLLISGLKNREKLNKLVYFSHTEIEKKILPTLQFNFENGSGTKIRNKKQNTRYSVHGLHEYKGKFNPQVVRALFNIYNIQFGDKILDPFCGSGTTLVESAHDNISANGTDINPLAVFIANTKINALGVSSAEIIKCKKRILKKYPSIKKSLKLDAADDRINYLMQWFSKDILIQIESLRLSVAKLDDSLKNIILVVISNLLRDYSLQEPADLRIRRRFSPYPNISLLEQLDKSIDLFVYNLKEFQSNFNLIKSSNKAFNVDIKNSTSLECFKNESFDFAITSPPYATALPYIDTQRLSLIWLNLITAKEIRPLESELIGSREFKAKPEQLKWHKDFLENKKDMPEKVHSFCLSLNVKLRPEEGFRKTALPSLLYRYFVDMSLAFKEVYRLLKKGKYFCLIVGHNHTTIGSTKTDIDTPELLTHIGKHIGFTVHEVLELDAYQRYGIHSSNAVQKESLIVFKK